MPTIIIDHPVADPAHPDHTSFIDKLKALVGDVGRIRIDSNPIEHGDLFYIEKKPQ